MKTLIPILIGLLVGGCGTPDSNVTEEATVIQPTKEDVVGSYEHKREKLTFRVAFLDNGVAEHYLNDTKIDEDKWRIVGKEIHMEDKDGNVGVHRIGSDGSLIDIAVIGKKGIRTEYPKYKQNISQKLK